MANVSIREAVKFYQVSRPTLSKSLKSGIISGVKDDRGQWQIDRAELDRVYQARTVGFKQDTQYLPGKLFTTSLPENNPETIALKRENDLLREMLTRAETNTEHWRSMAERQQLLLEDTRPKGFLKKLLGR